MKDQLSGSRLKRNLLLLIIPGLLSAAFVFTLWNSHPDIEYWRDILGRILQFLEERPASLILAMAVLPGLGFPISPLLIFTGAVLGARYGMINTCLLILLAQAICSIWTYYLSAGPLRGIFQRYVLRKRELPPLSGQNAWRIASIIRITPGIPYALQNIALGVMGLPFRIYMIVSIPIQSLYSIGFIIGGGAMFKGRFGLALTALIFLVAVVLTARIFLNRNRKQC